MSYNCTYQPLHTHDQLLRQRIGSHVAYRTDGHSSLMKLDGEGNWQFVDKLDHDIETPELKAFYGMRPDPKAGLFHRHTGPVDEVKPEEVKTFATMLEDDSYKAMGPTNATAARISVQQSPSGPIAILDETWH